MYKLNVFDAILSRINDCRKFIQVVVGPRQVGKTTVVRQVMETYFGLRDFKVKNPQTKVYLIGGQGMPLETFFTKRAADFL